MPGPFDDGIRHPKIYAWTDDAHRNVEWVGKRDGAGQLKVGYTDRDDADKRIRESQGVKDPLAKTYTIELVEPAVADDGTAFKDTLVHKALVAAGIHRLTAPDGGVTEWFECCADEVLAAVKAVRQGASKPDIAHAKADFRMRPEQTAAVEHTAGYFAAHAGDGHPPHFLWNAKMRFGKTFTTYQLAKAMTWTRVLVLTYKPAVETAWRDDIEGHVDFTGWRFKGKSDAVPDLDDPRVLVWFASFQDVLGTDKDGNPKVKNLGLYDTPWDAVVIDEYHFGAWRDAARDLYLPGDPKEDFGEGDASEKKAIETPDVDKDFDPAGLEAALALEVNHFLYLSGTPFRALTQGEFLEDQVYNWTYSDEQRAKVTWDDAKGPNLYAALPKMYLLTYEMPEALKEVALNNFSEFSLTEFFRTDTVQGPDGVVGAATFIHEAQIQRWLNLLRGQDISGLWASVSSQVKPPLPYEDKNLLEALQHTIWYLPGVSACTAMRDLLVRPNNVFFHDYKVVVAAGAAAGMGALALGPVEQKIGKAPQTTKTITLSCGKLMTGVTVPGWAAILMLRELKSPETYFQAAFRVQSPWISTVVDTVDGGTTTLVHKNHCYVIDFSPNRALTQIVDYATRLGRHVASGKDNEKAIEEFMEFLPVLSFDGYSMQQLSAAAVLDYMTTGISSSMLARRWNSPELVTLNLAAMEAILANTELVESLENMPQFRNITNDLTAMISSNKELGKKKATKEKLSEDEKTQKKEAVDKRATLREKLRRFLTRVPAFMYLTDDREKSVKDVISQLEPGLFEKVTGLKIEQFGQLVDAGAFDNSKMDDAVWKFRSFEEPSLRYGTQTKLTDTVGGWSVARDARLASMIDAHMIAPGAVLTDESGTLTAVITEDYGVAVEGIRYDTPDIAAQVATGMASADGWTFWRTAEGYTLDDLGELAGTS